MTNLSIFIDESGDFGTIGGSEYYVLTFVFHNQDHKIVDQVAKLAEGLGNLGYPPDRAVHSGAIIRGEEEHRGAPINSRKAAFARLTGVTYQAFVFRKREYSDRLKLKGAISRAFGLFLRDNAHYFLSFDKVIAYYDNGQAEVTDIINVLFNGFFFDVEFRRVSPADYRLFQVADLCCTLELLRVKDANGNLSRSDLYFFGDRRSLRKDYLNKITRLASRPVNFSEPTLTR